LTSAKLRHTVLDMVKTLIRVRRANRAGFNAKHAQLLVRALNDEMGPDVKGRPDIVDPAALIWLVRKLNELSHAPQNSKGAQGDSHRHKNQRNGIAPLCLEISRFLKRYLAVPVLVPRSMYEPGADGWTFEWAREGHEPYVELRLVQTIVSMAQIQRISYLKQCEQCARWFFARSSIQRFCPKRPCKELFHRTNPGDKKRRNEWAKRNYRINRTANIK